MHDLSIWTIYGACAILVLLTLLTIIGATLSYLLWKHLDVRKTRRRGDVARGVELDRVSDHGRITDAAKVLAAIVVMTDSVEAMREQNSAEHRPIQRAGEDTNVMVRRILSRFGFLVATDPIPTDFAPNTAQRPAPDPPQGVPDA